MRHHARTVQAQGSIVMDDSSQKPPKPITEQPDLSILNLDADPGLEELAIDDTWSILIAGGGGSTGGSGSK